ncbi:MAG: tRNA (N(6)-L-threonylcarbamoyladenosine(37)-C(2))-methylthiotransferase MtaB [Alphaproteobacteria bacterium]|nr:tRNA (N(6)-L-threonylcarbamoyladenosine(37)-C(2))-methylthiotransferase MtaB [Alphaproteobacteria bacterium]MBT4085424.1 tRNA (N(6)-L-threonylcarbamoyladenosine(37)-C(2))-methylthiotransferase MtaB [Alphaproteobacteria bacterium]MBT4544498.1 tRNA (N(6)-L-threonylcarbamoyladenosine(37)-C(2))-methylthiotransferase MtaB [Alphaproteobacteria bacterium]MBT7747324.1 tRNA (N(6)-L-threonylcarbamoyladenosine(37)-C(2))-methylthiotransferase MtaB [Alphaproteobacteria bacterium]
MSVSDHNVPGRPEIITFGCRLNTYESEVMRRHGDELALDETIIVNTCAVTAEAERQARQAIRKARRQRPDARIVVTGCAAQINPSAYADMVEVDQVVGNHEKMAAKSFVDDAPALQVNDIMSVQDTAGHLVEGLDGRARAFLQVQQGCDHRCTFCIIPFGRGPSRSVPLGVITDQARNLVENGYREIVLTGVDITSFGADLPGKPSLGEMVRRLLNTVPGLDRLRISSIDAVEVDDELFDLIAHEPRLMPHLHLSLQAGDDMILKRMKRRHSREEAVKFCAQVREVRPDIVFGADLIAGFPTETDEMFENSLALIKDCGLTWLHVFPYSEREGTPAAQMPPVPGPVRKERAARMRKAGEEAVTAYLQSLVGKTLPVLIEKSADSGLTGRTEGFATVNIASALAPTGDIVMVNITGCDSSTLTGLIEQ